MTSEKTGTARLLRLAEFLRSLPRKRFNYGLWVGLDWQGAPDLSCGTTACALGWATTIPSFRRLGLKLVKDGGLTEIVLNGRKDLQDPFDVAAEIFGINISEALELFYPDDGEENATPKHVAKKIEKFVAARA